MRQLPSQYVLGKFFAHAGEPIFRKFDGIYNASCPICREGKSWLKKKRLYYYPSTNSFYCFNCSKSWSALHWIEECTGLSRQEIELEASFGDNSVDISSSLKENRVLRKEKPNLPYDSINILDSTQQKFYENNPCFQKTLEYVVQRRLDVAINRCNNYYISLTDYFHKNRLCIPYYNRENKINFYQTRALDNSEPRYLNKIGYDKTVFGLNTIKTNLEYIFLFEGPIDAMFVQNGVSLAGLTMSEIQNKQLQEFPFHEKIWVLDNPAKDSAAKEKIFNLINKKERVFKWKANSPFKDFNEWAVKDQLTEIPVEEILNSCY